MLRADFVDGLGPVFVILLACGAAAATGSVLLHSLAGLVVSAVLTGLVLAAWVLSSVGAE